MDASRRDCGFRYRTTTRRRLYGALELLGGRDREADHRIALHPLDDAAEFGLTDRLIRDLEAEQSAAGRRTTGHAGLMLGQELADVVDAGLRIEPDQHI